MDNEYWTTEHADLINENLESAQYILDSLKACQEAHERGGVFFETTKKFLKNYRLLRYDIVNEKMLKTAESIEMKEIPSTVTLDHILAMPEIYTFYSKEISNFISSNAPQTIGMMVHAVDCGIRILSEKEDKDTPLRYSEILKASYIDVEQTRDELVKQFNTNIPTFNRKRNEAITALSIIIFGPLGDRHPSSLFDDNRLNKKFRRFIEVADAMDNLIDFMEIKKKYDKN